MALISARVLTKCGQYLADSLLLNARSITLANVKYVNHTVTDEKKSPEGPPLASPSQDEAAQNVNEDVEKLNKEIIDLNKRNNELTDKYKRALADGENLRNRLTKQIGDAKLFGIQSFCKDMLEIADVLEKATESVPKEQINNNNPHLKSLYEGLLMTEAQLKAVFKRHGLEPVNPINEKFNPNFHEALFQQEIKDKQPGLVISVSKIGYKLHDRVIRPALVGVAK